MDLEQTTNHGAQLFVLAVVGAIWYFVVWFLGILGCYTARRYRLQPRSPLASGPASSVPGVTVIRPLKGLDTNLFENLESTFLQDYPNFEVIMAVADSDDQALPVVRNILAKYPHVDARVLIGEEVVGINPKINNIIKPYRQAKNDIIWVLDSNVSVAPGTMARSVDALLGPTPKPNGARPIGLVHHVPCAVASELGLGSRIEEAFLNTNHAKMYLAINILSVGSCVVGKSNMYRRSDVDQVSGDLNPISSANTTPKKRGLAAFGRFLAEDNMIGTALWCELGLRHSLSCDVAYNSVGNMSFPGYVSRRIRWIRVRKYMTIAATCIEPFTECVLLSILAMLSFQHLFGTRPLLFFVLHYAAWIAVDLDVYASLAGYPLPPERRWSFFLSWAVRELLAFPIWAMAVCGEKVQWRGTTYRNTWRAGVLKVQL